MPGLAIGSFPTFKNPFRDFPKNPSRADSEDSFSSEFVFAGDGVRLESIFCYGSKIKIEDPEVKAEIDRDINTARNYTWIDPYLNNPTEEMYESYAAYLEYMGMTRSEVDSIMEQAIYFAKRGKDWAKDNENNADLSSKFLLASLPFGALKSVFKNVLSVPSWVNGIVNFVDGGLVSLNSKFIHDLYNRDNDAVGGSKYKAETYDIPEMEKITNMATTAETKLNPFLLPLSGVLGADTQKNVWQLLRLPDLLWSRFSRLHQVNIRLSSDLLGYLIHSPLAKFGFEGSQKKLEKINKRGTLEFDYLVRRIKEIAGIPDEVDSPKKLFGLMQKKIKSLSSDIYSEKVVASGQIASFLEAPLGLYGFYSSLIGMPTRAIMGFFGKQSRIVDAFSQTAIASRSLTNYFGNDLIGDTSVEFNHKNCGLPKDYYKREKNAFFINSASLVTNLVSPFLKLFKFKNSYFNLVKDIFDDVTDKLPYYRQSIKRRNHALGYKVIHHELYSDEKCRVVNKKDDDEAITEEQREGVVSSMGRMHTMPEEKLAAA